MGMWHALQKLTLLKRVFLKETNLGGRGYVRAHRACGLIELMHPAGKYLEWEWGLHVDFPETLGKGDAG